MPRHREYKNKFDRIPILGKASVLGYRVLGRQKRKRKSAFERAFSFLSGESVQGLSERYNSESILHNQHCLFACSNLLFSLPDHKCNLRSELTKRCPFNQPMDVFSGPEVSMSKFKFLAFPEMLKILPIKQHLTEFRFVTIHFRCRTHSPRLHKAFEIDRLPPFFFTTIELSFLLPGISCYLCYLPGM